MDTKKILTVLGLAGAIFLIYKIATKPEGKPLFSSACGCGE